MRDNFAVDSFHTKKLCSRLSSRKSTFRREWAILRFWLPFRGLEAAYDVHLGLKKARLIDFLLVITELFFARSKDWGARANIDWKWPFFDATVSACPKNFRQEGTYPTNHSSCQKTIWIPLSYGIRMSTELSFVLSQFTRLTDRQTDAHRKTSPA